METAALSILSRRVRSLLAPAAGVVLTAMWCTTGGSYHEGAAVRVPTVSGSSFAYRATSPMESERGIDASRRLFPMVAGSSRLPAAPALPSDEAGASVSTPPSKAALAQAGCTICIEGSVHNSWSGDLGSFSTDYVRNHRNSGTSGTLQLQTRLTSAYPVFGQTISSYSQSDPYVLGQLDSGHYYYNIFSGTLPYHNSSIPPGQYYNLLMLYEYSGGTFYYQDFVVLDQVVTCDGSGCHTTVSPTATPTIPISACTPDDATLCLFDGRFRVTTVYKDYSGNTGSGHGVALSGDSGYFWFFDPSNVEVVAKIVSFCNGSSGNYGIYASGLTDVKVTFFVTDTATGTSKTYENPLGTRFCTIRDGPFSCP